VAVADTSRVKTDDAKVRPPLLVGALGDRPDPVAGAEGRYFWDFDGKRYLDFASQLVNVSLGHQHPKVIAAIKEQADRSARSGR
jgi:4-aminobutyrate aminotransferase-like enzyme